MTDAAEVKEQRRIAWLYRLLVFYNGMVVLLMAGFMSLTQQKIIDTMMARSFLKELPIVPLPAETGMALALGAFGVLLVLEKLFGIDKENMANQVNLTYTRSFQEAVESVEKGESQCAFILNPTRVAEIRDVAAAGEKMPQKSTYFYPKLITGLVMNPLK